MKTIVIDHPNKVTRREIRKRGGELFYDPAGQLFVVVMSYDRKNQLGVAWKLWLTSKRAESRYW